MAMGALLSLGGWASAQTVVPAKIEAESYSNMAGVQLEGCSEGTQNVGWIDTGDWMVYPITVPTTGSYTIQYRVASPNGTGALSSDLNAGATQLGTVTVPNTGGWQNWTTISQVVTLNAGTTNLGIFAQAGGWNLNWINVVSNGTPVVTTINLPAKFEAENYTAMGGVMTEACSEGTLNVGSIDTNDWMNYAVKVTTSGSYKIEYRVSSIYSTAVLAADLNGGAIPLGSLAVPNTGGWQTWTTISHIVPLNAGTYTFAVWAKTGGFNLNWVNVTAASDGGLQSAPSTPIFIANQAAIPAPSASMRGASLPWITHEAEAGQTSGTVLGPNRTVGDPAGEASGRQCVRLAGSGQYVQWTVTRPANALVLRYSVPDAPAGGGKATSLTLYRNGSPLQSLALTSKYAWLYGDEGTPSDTPSGNPRHIYDEMHTLLAQVFNVGDTLRLQVNSAYGDASPTYDIDFVELENALSVSQPSGSVNAVSLGADPSGKNDSVGAIEAAIAQAKSSGQIVWIPAGRYLQSRKINASGVTIQGAGMWCTTILGVNSWSSNVAVTGFNVAGNNTAIRDLAVQGECHIRDTGDAAFSGVFGSYSTLSNLWVEHANSAVWEGQDYSSNPGTNLRIEGCRFRNLGADGINLCNGAQNCVVTNTSTRSTGDDGIAIWSESAHTSRPSQNNLIQYCTVQTPWRASGIAIYGGYGNTVANCSVADTLVYPGLTLSTQFWPYAFSGTTSVRDVDLMRCGGAFWGGQAFGALWIMTEDSDMAAPVQIRNLAITDSTFAGVHIQCENIKVNPTWADTGTPTQIVPGNLLLDGLTITRPGTYGIHARAKAKGSVTFNNTTINSAAWGTLQNEAGGNFNILRTGSNNW